MKIRNQRKGLIPVMSVVVSILLSVCISVSVRGAGVSFTSRVENYGELRGSLGDRLLEIDSLKVIGPIDGSDFRAMYESSFYGRLSWLDLSSARPKDWVLPDTAFFHRELQEETKGGTIIEKPIKLRYIVLPDSLRSIGERAFEYVPLASINFPETLEEFGYLSLGSVSLKGHLRIPSRVKTIALCCFSHDSLITSIELPSGLKEIGGYAFWYNKGLREIHLPEGLELLGEGSFANCDLLDYINIPAGMDVKTLGGFLGGPFSWSAPTRIDFAPGITRIPNYLFFGMRGVKTIAIPETVEEIGSGAFEHVGLTSIVFPPRLKKIGSSAFNGKIEYILPSSVEQIDGGGFWNPGILRFMGSKPPRIVDFEVSDEKLANGDYSIGRVGIQFLDPILESSVMMKEFPIHIPKGSLEAYAKRPYNMGWEYFENFIEDMPSTGGVSELFVEEPQGGYLRVYRSRDGIAIELTTGDSRPYSVYTVDGRCHAEGEICRGSAWVSAPAGIYIVRVGNQSAKIRI